MSSSNSTSSNSNEVRHNHHPSLFSAFRQNNIDRQQNHPPSDRQQTIIDLTDPDSNRNSRQKSREKLTRNCNIKTRSKQDRDGPDNSVGEVSLSSVTLPSSSHPPFSSALGTFDYLFPQINSSRSKKNKQRKLNKNVTAVEPSSTGEPGTTGESTTNITLDEPQICSGLKSINRSLRGRPISTGESAIVPGNNTVPSPVMPIASWRTLTDISSSSNINSSSSNSNKPTEMRNAKKEFQRDNIKFSPALVFAKRGVAGFQHPLGDTSVPVATPESTSRDSSTSLSSSSENPLGTRERNSKRKLRSDTNRKNESSKNPHHVLTREISGPNRKRSAIEKKVTQIVKDGEDFQSKDVKSTKKV